MKVLISFDANYASFDISPEVPALLADKIKSVVRKELQDFYQNNHQ